MRSQGEKGFTLLELIIIIVMIVTILTLVMVIVSGEQSKQQSTGQVSLIILIGDFGNGIIYFSYERDVRDEFEKALYSMSLATLS
jgi:competence protein ComGC